MISSASPVATHHHQSVARFAGRRKQADAAPGTKMPAADAPKLGALQQLKLAAQLYWHSLFAGPQIARQEEALWHAYRQSGLGVTMVTTDGRVVQQGMEFSEFAALAAQMNQR